MKKLISTTVLALALLVGVQTAVQATSAASFTYAVDPIHPQDVNELLKAAADEWNLTLGQARQAYNHGALTLTRDLEAGPHAFMVAYEGGCILVVLEDEQF